VHKRANLLGQKITNDNHVACTTVLKQFSLKISFISNILQFITSLLARVHQDELNSKKRSQQRVFVVEKDRFNGANL